MNTAMNMLWLYKFQCKISLLLHICMQGGILIRMTACLYQKGEDVCSSIQLHLSSYIHAIHAQRKNVL